MIVNTGIKASPKFMEILNACIGQMSDGIWENTPSMEKYWKSIHININAAGCIEIEDRWYTCADPVAFMANKIKQIIKIEIDDGNDRLEWSRNCSAVPQYITYGSPITVGDCYELYELLKGRNTSKHTYSSFHPYHVQIDLAGRSFNYVVEALTESEAKQQAIKNFNALLTVSVTQ